MWSEYLLTALAGVFVGGGLSMYAFFVFFKGYRFELHNRLMIANITGNYGAIDPLGGGLLGPDSVGREFDGLDQSAEPEESHDGDKPLHQPEHLHQPER